MKYLFYNKLINNILTNICYVKYILDNIIFYKYLKTHKIIIHKKEIFIR